MKAKTRLQHKVAAANGRLLPITETQKQWAFRNALTHYAYRAPSGRTTCLDCGHQWKTEGEETCRCPECGAELKIENTLHRTARERTMFSVLTTQNGLQVQRVFRMDAFFHKKKRPKYTVTEVCRMWIDENGKTAVTGLRRTIGHYLDSFAYGTDLELRQENFVYDHLADNSFVCPRYKTLPTIRRNGLKGTLPDIPPMRLIKAILTDSRAETLMKAGRTDELAYLIDNPGQYETCWQPLKIAIRQGYGISDIQMWVDYIQLLQRLGKDMHNAHYVCPKDLRAEHDRVLRKVQDADAKKERDRKRNNALADEKAFQRLKGKYFGISFTDGEITVSVIDSVMAYLDEAIAMHHCVFDLHYYLKPKSLCLSARIDGKRIETVELSLESFKVLQSRGVCNSNTEYHDRVMELVKKNAYLIRQRAAS